MVLREQEKKEKRGKGQ